MIRVAQIRLKRRDGEPTVEDVLNGWPTPIPGGKEVWNPGICNADAIIAVSSHNVTTPEDTVEPVLVVLYRA